MTSSLFQLPDDLLATVLTSFPGREPQIRTLGTLLYPRAAPCRNLVVHGAEATGKSAITAALLSRLSQAPVPADDGEPNLNYAIVRSPECVTARHLFERSTGAVADALGWESPVGRCETLAALTVELSKMLKYAQRAPGWRFILVFDAIDRQREAPPTLLPALARLSEIIPNLTSVFIVTAPPPSLLRTAATPHLHFPPYTKSQFTAILSAAPPPPLPNTTQQETTELYSRFVAAVHDSLTRPASRTLPSLRQAAGTLWPRFTAPVAAGTHKAREFSKLLVTARVWLQDESVLAPGIVFRSSSGRAPASANPSSSAATAAPPPPARSTATTPTGTPRKTPTTPGSAAARRALASAAAPNAATTDLTALLPPTAKLLLVAAYLASHNAPRHDQTLFSTWHHAGRRRRGGGLVLHHRGPRPKHRKIARKLLGPGVFVLERMVAIYVALRRERGGRDLADGSGGAGVDADVAMAIATLASLRLLLKVGGAAAAGGAGGAVAGDMDRGGRWRVGVGWEVVRGVGRSIGLEVEEWLIE